MSLPPSAFPLNTTVACLTAVAGDLQQRVLHRIRTCFPLTSPYGNCSLEITAKIQKIRDFCIFASLLYTTKEFMGLVSKFQEWQKKEFVRNSFMLLSTSTLAQIISFGVYPLLTRLYTPEDFGVVNVLLSIVGLLAILSTGRYEPALVLERDDKSAKSLFQLIVLINLGLFVVGQLVFTLFARPIGSLFHTTGNMERWLPLIPVMVLMAGLWQCLNNFCVRQKKFKVIGEYNMVKSTSNAGLKLAFGYAGMLRSGLVVSTIIAYFSALALSLVRMGKQLKGIFEMDRSRVREMAVKYANFPKFELPNALSNMLAGNLPMLLLPFFFGMDEIGMFSLALTLGFCPVGLFTGSMDQVLYKNMVEKYHNQESLKPVVSRFCRNTAVGLLPFFVLFFFIAEWFFTVLFGAQWSQAGVYFKIMLPWLFMVTMTASLTAVPKIFFKQRTAMLIEFTYIFFRVAALFVGIWRNDFTLAVICFSTVSAIMVTAQLVWYFSLISRHEKCLK